MRPKRFKPVNSIDNPLSEKCFLVVSWYPVEGGGFSRANYLAQSTTLKADASSLISTSSGAALWVCASAAAHRVAPRGTPSVAEG